MDCEPVRADEKKLIPREEKEKNINRLVLKHCVGGTEHLSFLSGSHMSPTESIPLPFDGDDEVRGSSCRGLFYFSSYFESEGEGKVVICNLTTKKLKVLTPPSPDAFYCDHGLGYDPESDDYKVIRNHCPASTAEVYSLKDDSWKVIPGPGDDVTMDPECGVYMDGRCYWVTVAYIPGSGVEDFILKDFILSFDFSNETFSRMPLPPPLRPPVSPPLLPGQYDRNFKVDIFDCDGFLGVVGCKRLPDYKTRVARHFELWVYSGGSWERFFSVILLDVERPLGLSDNRFLFLEGNNSCGHRHLMVYDWVKEELREHDIYVKPPNGLLLLSYVENTVVLPDAKPLINSAQNVEDSSKKALKRCRPVPKRISHSSSGMALKRCPRGREKTGRIGRGLSGMVLNRCSRREKALKPAVLKRCSQCLPSLGLYVQVKRGRNRYQSTRLFSLTKEAHQLMNLRRIPRVLNRGRKGRRRSKRALGRPLSRQYLCLTVQAVESKKNPESPQQQRKKRKKKSIEPPLSKRARKRQRDKRRKDTKKAR